MIDHSTLISFMDYNQFTGIFTWREKPRRKAMSLTAGSVDPYGYRRICIKQTIYKAHRLAWFYHYKKWPTKQIDHINGNKDDNRISNLRESNFSMNQANSKRRVNNKCGYKGVYLHKLSGLYMARVMINQKSILLGYFKTAKEAHQAYVLGAKKHFGEYARAA